MTHTLSQVQLSPNETAAPAVSEWFSRASTSALIAPNREGDLRNTQPNRPDMDEFVRGDHRRV